MRVKFPAMHNKNFCVRLGPIVSRTFFLQVALQMLERSEDAALVGRALPLLVAREPFVYVRGFRDGLHAYDAEFAARFKLSGLRALPPPVGWPS